MLLASLLLSSSCISVVWERDRWHRPPAVDTVDALHEGTDLEACLELLGAPLKVWQVGDGYALSWAWYDSRELSYKLQIPLGQGANTSIKHTNIGRETEGLLLLFDANDELVFKEQGFLLDLMGENIERSPALPLRSKDEA